MKNSHTNISFSGPGYVTKAIHILENGVQKVATSRRHRKGRGALFFTSEGVKAGSRYFCESLFWASQPKQAAKT
ncbi:hypothetical protein BPLS_P0324 [Bathymodiolus platifrons methanotrophic gill symbiont]|nr:hypothetical protein BPLS_P0324 [Bathymodiolus platifrons methanotrophic gill symbiont]